MAVEGEEQELRETVKRLEATVASLESRIARLEASGAQPTPAPVVPPPMPSVAPPVAPAPGRRDLEAHLGTYWLSRVGIVALIIGIAYLITYHFGELGILARVAAGYLLSAGLAAFGLWLSRRYQLFGRIVFGGGLALAYFVTYALHFIPAVRVIDSQVLALVLLALLVVGIVAIAQRMHSETVAGVALFLGLHTGMLSDVTAFTLLSTSLLAGGALFFLIKNRWVIVPLSSLVAVYTTHVAWALRADSLQPDSERLGLSLGFLALYFVLFSVALLARPRELPWSACLAFALLNWLGVLLLGGYEVSVGSDAKLFTFLLVVALAQLASAAGARVQRAPPALLHAYLALGAITLALAMPARYEDLALVGAWTLTGAVAGVASRGVASPVLRWVGLGILGVALLACGLLTPGRVLPLTALFASFLLVERMSTVRAPGLPEPLPGGSLFKATCAAGAGLALVWLVGGQMPAGLVTLGWVVGASGLFAVGFALKERWYRLAGLGVLALALGRLVVVDLARLPANQRIVTFILLGVLLLAISYIYTRVRDRRE